MLLLERADACRDTLADRVKRLPGRTLAMQGRAHVLKRYRDAGIQWEPTLSNRGSGRCGLTGTLAFFLLVVLAFEEYDAHDACDHGD
jgi:hypothetical protein